MAAKQLTPEQSDLLLSTSAGAHFAVCGRIRNKKRQLVRPVPNIFQVRMAAAYEWCLDTGRPPRIFGLKPRRVGGSTVSAHLAYFHGRRFSSRAVTIADTNLKSAILFDMVTCYGDNDPFPWGGQRFQHNATIARYGPDSEVVKRSAEAPRQTRGDTLQAAILSEAAWWRDVGPLSADETATALVNALADHPTTLGIIDTTPHGARGYAFNVWQGATWPEYPEGPENLFSYWRSYSQQNAEEPNDWLRVFAAWFEFPEHRQALEVGDQERMEATLTERERAGRRKYKWTWEQIKWRRWAVRNKCLGDERRFDEEYPEDPSMCWLSSGSPVFDAQGMALLTVEAGIQPRVMAYDWLRGRMDAGVHVRQDPEGAIYEWEAPKKGCSYLVVVDPCESREVVSSTRETDRHSVLVLRDAYKAGRGDYRRAKVVARVKPPSYLDDAVLAELIAQLSARYGHALTVVENNKGVGILRILQDKYYTPLYRQKRLDTVTGRSSRILGWRTDENTRRLAVAALQEAVREQMIEVPDMHVVGEMATFVHNQQGKAEAGAGSHDDDVIALAIGMACMDSATPFVERVDEVLDAEDAAAWKEA